MKKQIIEEIKDMKYLLNYNRGRILSEQPEVKEVHLDEYEEELYSDMDDYSDEVPSFDLEGMFKGMSKPNGDMELDEEMDLPVMLPGTKEKERIKIDPGTKPKQPKTPYKPKPGPKPDPKAGRKGDMPDWLTFDELGIEFE